MHITGEVTLGTILTIATLVGIAIGIGRRMGGFEATVKNHAETLSAQSSRMVVYQDRMIEFVGTVQRLIGRIEVSEGLAFQERRKVPRA